MYFENKTRNWLVGREAGINRGSWIGRYVSDDPADVVTWEVWTKDAWIEQPGVSAKSTGNSSPFPLPHAL